ncbi:hypothetical protein Cni_G00267 [Canna indica]|uniref:Uncharacterized protein n=1 Tax=Canna indica TaxID=4628 RepID=A0AAQ3JL27_9LILI|nr:hypothetical protein Cni_G00267 [Canna indica]
MDAVVVVGQIRSQHYSRGKSQASGDFRGINCRSFESVAGILPSPRSRRCSCSNHPEPKSPNFYSEPPKHKRKRRACSQNSPPSPKGAAFTNNASCSELWAGPAYSNSPPPSSLPIPKFSLRPKRSVSLEINIPKSIVLLHSISKSAPSSPIGEPPSSACNFLFNAATATENLRRILQLDIADD